MNELSSYEKEFNEESPTSTGCLRKATIFVSLKIVKGSSPDGETT